MTRTLTDELRALAALRDYAREQAGEWQRLAERPGGAILVAAAFGARATAYNDMAERLAAALEAAPGAVERGAWVAVSEREPDVYKTVLLADRDGSVWPGQRERCHCEDLGEDYIRVWGSKCVGCERFAEEGTWYTFDGGDQSPAAHVTHWMPMPKGPAPAARAGDAPGGEDDDAG